MAWFANFTMEEVHEVDIKCMWCGCDCQKTETVYTGDEESYKGFELWCYCEKCETDTFKKLTSKETNIDS